MKHYLFSDGSQVHLEISHAVSPSSTSDSNQSTADLFLDMFSKKGKLLSKLASFDSEGGSRTTHGSSIMSLGGDSPDNKNTLSNHPAFRQSHQSTLSIRSAVSDSEVEQGNNRNEKRGSIWSSKSSLSAGFRYHGGNLLPTTTTPSPEAARTYLFEGNFINFSSSLLLFVYNYSKEFKYKNTFFYIINIYKADWRL